MENRTAVGQCSECGRTSDSLSGWLEDFVEEPPGTSFLAQFCGPACAGRWFRRHSDGAARQHILPKQVRAPRRLFLFKGRSSSGRGSRPTLVYIDHTSHTDAAGYSHRVAQASGIVTVQAACSISNAIVLMETRAVSMHTTLEQVAAAVIDHEIRFDV